MDIIALDHRGNPRPLKVDAEPDSCPVCHRGIEPIRTKVDFFANLPTSSSLERVFRCPRKDCQHLFVARYKLADGSANFFNLSQCVPAEPRDEEYPPELKKISPDFCAIHNEAHKAEQLGLLLVCGPGYRKALEFLIKDYLIVKSATDDDKKRIPEMPLMNCIKQYVTEDRIKITAARAVWLGNDETHFVRKWEDKDLKDMKKFIQLTCYWIQSAQLTDDAVADMP
jgi:hypothetical protein